MNMKNIITVCARLLQKEELKGQGFLTITTAAGIIHGIPVLADYNGANLDEKLMIKILSDFCQSSAQNSFNWRRRRFHVAKCFNPARQCICKKPLHSFTFRRNP